MNIDVWIYFNDDLFSLSGGIINMARSHFLRPSGNQHYTWFGSTARISIEQNWLTIRGFFFSIRKPILDRMNSYAYVELLDCNAIPNYNRCSLYTNSNWKTYHSLDPLPMQSINAKFRARLSFANEWRNVFLTGARLSTLTNNCSGCSVWSIHKAHWRMHVRQAEPLDCNKQQRRTIK